VFATLRRDSFTARVLGVRIASERKANEELTAQNIERIPPVGSVGL
jgi:hypothetical protein